MCKEEIIGNMKQQVEDLWEELGKSNDRCTELQREVVISRREIQELTVEIEKYKGEKRELELMNDDWERSKR